MSNVDPSPLPDASGVQAKHAVQVFVQFMRVVRHRKHVVGMALAVSFLLGGLYYGTATRLYQAKASLLVLQTGGDMLSTSMSTEGSRQGLMPTYERLFNSVVVLEGAIPYIEAKHQVDLLNTPREEWAASLRKRLTATTLRQTNIIEVGYLSRDAEASAAVVGAVLRSYLEFLNKTHRGTAGDIIDVLTKEKVQLELKLATKEQEVLNARRSFGDLGIRADSQTLHPTLKRAINFNEALVKAQEKRLELQASMAAIQSAVRNGQDLQQHVLALEGTVGREFLLSGLGFSTRDSHVQAELEKTLLQDRAELRSLAEFYGPGHPRVVEISDRVRVSENYLSSYQARIEHRLTEMRNTQLAPMLVQMMEQRLNEAVEHEKYLENSFEGARAQAIALHGDLAKVEIMEHDLKWLRNLRDVLLEQIASVDLKQDHGEIRTAVVSEPMVPTGPVSPRLQILIVLCLLGGLGGGIGAVYVLDLLDDRFRSPEDLREQLRIPVLAMIRPLSDLPPGSVHSLHLCVAPDSVESEAFRTLRTSLDFAQQDTTRLVVSSAEPGDGKTTVIGNLAVSYAQAGKRVLLIDADMRRPGLTSMLGLKGTTGLSDILASDQPIRDLATQVACTSEVEGLTIIPAGTRRANPGELLAGPRIAELLSWAEGAFDQILIDCPPAMAASDAALVGRLVDGLILVVQPQKNQRRVVFRAADSFTSVHVNVLGTVLNRVEAGADGGYGYGYGYTYGYHSDPDDASAANDEPEDFSHEETHQEERSAASRLVIPRRVA